MSESVVPFRLRPMPVERVWGRHDLRPWYDVHGSRAVGEVWLTGDACTVESGPAAGKALGEAFGHLPLLVKMLFPQDKLSVQVHPDDADAARLGDGAQAKTECWYVLAAEPGATVALGLRPGADVEAVRRAIHAGTLESLLEHVPVAVGDMVYVPAGTIHAIGHGVVLLEIQQNSDTTYRLYDYGRPRELHLDKGLAVLKAWTAAGKVPAKASHRGVQLGGVQLISVPHFTVERYEIDAAMSFHTPTRTEVWITLGGSGFLSWRQGAVKLLAGEAVVVPAGTKAVMLDGPVSVVRCFV